MSLSPSALPMPPALLTPLPPGRAFPGFRGLGGPFPVVCGEAGPMPLNPLLEVEREKSLPGGAVWKGRKATTFL